MYMYVYIYIYIVKYHCAGNIKYSNVTVAEFHELGPYKEIMVEIFHIPLCLKSNLLVSNNKCKIIGIELLSI